VQEPAGAEEVVLETLFTVELDRVVAEDEVDDRVPLEVDMETVELLELVLEGPVPVLLL
jgi:hypothetical protein